MAQDRLAEMYENGRGVARDYARAIAWYRKSSGSQLDIDRVELLIAAERGDIQAQITLAQKYMTGDRATPQDDAKAMIWYRKAAKQDTQAARDARAVLDRLHAKP